MIRDTAIEYGVNPDRAVAVARCESNLEIDVQSNHTWKDGEQERSFGLWQVHLDSHPTVTREMAIDPVWSTRWAMEHLSKGRWSMWTCARLLGFVER